jgi:hypothetical protein
LNLLKADLNIRRVVLAASLLLVGCAPQAQQDAVAPVRAPAILPPPGMNLLVRESLGEWYPEARWVKRGDLAPALERCLQEDRVLLLPEANRLPLDEAPVLLDFLHAGGRLAFLGTDPFALGLRQTGQGYATRQEQEQTRMEAARPVARAFRIQLWSHQPDRGQPKGRVRIVPEGDVPWPAVLVSVDDFDRHDVLISPDLTPGALDVGPNTEMVFYARGDAGTTRLVVLAKSTGASTWVARVPLSVGWRPHLLSASDFYRVGPTGKASDESLPDFKGVYQLQIGLDAALAPQAEGGHLYGLS